MPIILILFISLVAQAGTLSVVGHRNYQLEYSPDKILLKTPISTLRFDKKKCSEKVFQDFLHKMKKIEALKHQKNFEGDFRYILNGNPYQDKSKSAKANLIDSVPEELERMKIEENLRCKK